MTGFEPDQVYALLRHLTPPVSAVTTSAAGVRNGFIINSGQRASLVPTLPRLAFYSSKTNHSHDLLLDGGVFTLHLLRADQWSVIETLGLQSARDGIDKLAALEHSIGSSGCPVLADCAAAFECRIVNTMDAGAATFVLGDVLAIHLHDADAAIMTSERFRRDAPDELRRRYEAKLRVAQRQLEEIAGEIEPGRTWKGARSGP